MKLEIGNSSEKQLKSVYLVRHGEYGSNGSLTVNGMQNSSEISYQLAISIKDETRAVFVSPALRTVETGFFVAHALKVQRKIEAALGLPEGQKNPQGIMSLMQAYRYQVQNLILVTHFEVAGKFTKYLLKNVYELDMKILPFGTAEAWQIDMKTGDVTHICASAK